jgi:hypothetical protein
VGDGLAIGIIVLLAVIYLLQSASSLRINTDSYRLLSMAVSAFEGHGYLVDGNKDMFPPAYPWLIKCMLQLGVANSHTLILLNILSLAVGLSVLYGWGKWLLSRLHALLMIGFVLLSWVLIKHVTIPLTDTVFLGLSMLAMNMLCLYCKTDGWGKWGWYAAALLMTYASLRCRTSGVALLPVLGMSLLAHRQHCQWASMLTRHRGKLLVAGIVLGMLCLYPAEMLLRSAWIEARFNDPSNYFHYLIVGVKRDGLLLHIIHTLQFRVQEMGEILCNAPINKMPRFAAVFYVAGGLGWLMILRGMWLLFDHRALRPVPWYFFSYTCMLCCWPFYDTRFWLPLLPVIAILLWASYSQIQTRFAKFKYAGMIYLLGVLLLGSIALVFSTRISLAGKQFSEVYGNGSAKMTYRYALDNGLPVEMDKVNMRDVRLLEIFETRAKDRHAETR